MGLAILRVASLRVASLRVASCPYDIVLDGVYQLRAGAIQLSVEGNGYSQLIVESEVLTENKTRGKCTRKLCKSYKSSSPDKASLGFDRPPLVSLAPLPVREVDL